MSHSWENTMKFTCWQPSVFKIVAKGKIIFATVTLVYKGVIFHGNQMTFRIGSDSPNLQLKAKFIYLSSE